MRRTIIAIAVALAVAVPARAAPLVNQLENGDFEDFQADDPVDWRILSGNANPTTDSVSGQAVVLNFVGTETVSGIAQNVTPRDDDAPIVPNLEYDLAFSSNLETETTTTSVSAQAKIVWKNALGEPSRVDTVAIDPSDTYVDHDETFRAPADATEAEIQFELTRPTKTSATNANLKVDAAAFGPSSP